METLIIIAKSAAILSLFYLTYRMVLQKDTFFSANRHYLLGGILAALILPFLEFTQISLIDMPVYESLPTTTRFSPVVTETTAIASSFSVDWWMVALVTYLIGIGIMFSRLGIQLASLHRLIQRHSKTKMGRYTFVEVYDDIAPFSFFQTIVYNPNLHTAAELKMILDHEKVHAIQWHTIDVLLTQITLAIQWANPLAWMYKESLEQNLEFIADSEAARVAASSTAYQRTLVKVSSTALRPALTNNFYHSLIKKRIVMLNKEASRRRNLWKLGLVLPILAFFMYSFNVKEVIEYREVSTPTNEAMDSAFAKADIAPTNTFKERIIENTAKNINFSISDATTKEELELIENYFLDSFENTRVRFTKLNYRDGKLLSFDFQTKMASETRFMNRYSIAPTNATIQPFRLIAVGEHEILQIHQDGSQVKFTPDEAVTTFVHQTSQERMGKNPVLIVNGKIVDVPKVSHLNYTANANVQSVLPSKAVQLYGAEARDGAFIIDDLNITINDNETSLQKSKAFVINHKTTDVQLRAIEGYFAKEHPDALIEIYGVKRNAAGALISYDVRTKFAQQNEWNQIIGVHNAASVSQGMQVNAGEDSNGPTVDLKELGPKGIQMRSTPDGLLLEDEALGRGLVAMNEGFSALSEDVDAFKEQSQQSFRVKISKNTTLEELKAMKASLKKDHNVDFDYSDVDFNSNNEITGISIKYKAPNENSGNYNVHGKTGIADFYFYMEADGAVGIGNDKSVAETKERMAKRRIEIEKRRESRQGEMKERMEKRKEELKVRAEKRIVEMEERTKERKEEMKERRKELKERLHEHEEIIEEREEEMKLHEEEMKERMHELEEIIEDREVEIRENGGNTFVFSEPSDVSGSELFIVSNDAGVTSRVMSGVTSLMITKNTSDEELKRMKQDFKSKGIEMKYSKVKRNSQGAITGISLKLQRGDSKSTTSFSSNNPIQTIWLGYNEK